MQGFTLQKPNPNADSIGASVLCAYHGVLVAFLKPLASKPELAYLLQ